MHVNVCVPTVRTHARMVVLRSKSGHKRSDSRPCPLHSRMSCYTLSYCIAALADHSCSQSGTAWQHVRACLAACA